MMDPGTRQVSLGEEIIPALLFFGIKTLPAVQPLPRGIGGESWGQGQGNTAGMCGDELGCAKMS